MAISNPFSLSSMLDVLPTLRLPTARETNEEETPATPPPPRGISMAIPAPGFCQPIETNIPIQNQPLTQYSYSCGCAVSNSQKLDEMTLQALFNLMTSSQHDVADLFEKFFSSFNPRQLHKMASLLTSDLNYFMEMATHEYGSKRLQKLLGKSHDVDALFCDAIFFCFLHVMTNKHACFVAVRAMRVFDQAMKEKMYEYTLQYALQIAGCQHGCIALNEIINDLDHPYYRNMLLDLVADNALFLSNDAYGNFVVQHVLRLNDLRCSYNIADKLRGHCVDLSFKKHGSYIVERLLEAAFESTLVVVVDLLECKEDRLVRLARSEYGNFVVAKALRFTHKMDRADLFFGLVEKLMPFRHLLRRSRGRNIADILDSV